MKAATMRMSVSWERCPAKAGDDNGSYPPQANVEALVSVGPATRRGNGKLQTSLALLALLLLPLPVAAHHADAEAVVFDDFIARLSDTTQNPVETITIGHETTWHCAVRALYFDLMLYAGRFWPALPAQSAATAARGLADVHSDFCEATA